MLGVWAWSEMRTAVWQDWGNWVFNREIRQQSATVAEYLTERKDQLSADVLGWLGLRTAPAPAPPRLNKLPTSAPQAALERNELIGRLIIPRLQLSATVREGAEEDTLAVALGHIPSTALPGQKGNIGVAGHRDKLFRNLKEIRQNDRIEFETLSGTYVYEVGSTQIVKPSDVSVLKATNFSELTLVTCYPFYYVGSAPDRFIVKARLLSSKPRSQELFRNPDGGDAAGRPCRACHYRGGSKRPPRRSYGHTRVAGKPERVKYTTGAGRVGFNVPKDHSRRLADGIWFGVTGTDTASHQVSGWMWLMPDRRTIWLRNRSTDEPVVFYSIRDGKRRELRITNVTTSSAAGYLTLGE